MIAGCRNRGDRPPSRAAGTAHPAHAVAAERASRPNALGSTRGLTDGAEDLTDSRETDAWGLPLASLGSTATPFGFVGGQGYRSDADSGLLLLGAPAPPAPPALRVSG